jgi:tetratricopeptide (TPR) repeat protein
VAGRHAPDTLALLLPGWDAAAAAELCRELAREFHSQSERTASAGVAEHPQNGFNAAEALDNAAKALVHAGFFGPDTVTIFDAVSLNISGDALFAQGRIGEALAEYQRALLINPKEPNVLNSLGVCLGHLGQMEEAARHFAKAQEAAPSDFMAYYNLGYAWLAQGKPNQAREQLQKALELNPSHADTLFQLGRLAQSEGRPGAAVDMFSRAATQADCRPSVHRALGEALAADGRPAEAEEAFKKAVKINPSDPAALVGLAGLYLDRGANREIALDLARRAHRLMSDSVRYTRVLARAMLALERPAEALELLAPTADTHPDDPFLLVQLAQAEQALERPAEARDHLLAALRLEPNLESARAALAALEE